MSGETATYVLTVRNVGQGSAAGPIVVKDTLPAGLSLVSVTASPPWTCGEMPAGTVTCIHPGPLAPGATAPPIKMLVQVTANPGTVIINVGTVKERGDENSSNNSSSAVSPIYFPTVAPLLSGWGQVGMVGLLALAGGYGLLFRGRSKR